MLPDLLAAASGNPLAKPAIDVLKAWDGNADAASKGAVLFEAWWVIVMNDPSPAKDNTINYNTAHPKTPIGLADAAATVHDLILAAQLVQAAYGNLAVAWGDVHKIVLVTHDKTFQPIPLLRGDPQSGPDDAFG